MGGEAVGGTKEEQNWGKEGYGGAVSIARSPRSGAQSGACGLGGGQGGGNPWGVQVFDQDLEELRKEVAKATAALEDDDDMCGDVVDIGTSFKRMLEAKAVVHKEWQGRIAGIEESRREYARALDARWREDDAQWVVGMKG